MKNAHARQIPTELAAALHADPKARAAFESMPPSHQAEYAQFVSAAKKPATRLKRAAQSSAMMRAWRRGAKRR